MNWQEAISKSKNGTAIRKQKSGNYDETFIRYDDGSGFRIVAMNGKVDFDKSGKATPYELEGHNDWQPS